MQSKRSEAKILRGKNFFKDEMPIFINREEESFDTVIHSHDFWEIAYISEGRGVHLSGESTTKVSKGDLFMIPIGVSHVFRPNSIGEREPLIVYNCIIALEDLKNFLQSYPGGKELEDLLKIKEWKRYHDKSGRFFDLFQRMHFEYLANLSGREAKIYNGLMELLIFFYCEENRTYNESTKTENYIQEVLSIILSDYNLPLRVKDMASKMGIGERQFQRIFHMQTNMTFKDYLQGVRINNASRLLVNTHRKVIDIASSVGYQDLQYFNKLFKEKTGMSPSEYRRRMRP
ncbi:helix-turn-helix transcriptional regulator [Mesobacillus foraminis]|uniref:helix-turn-helix domain-containing protein n=1 Tax=Mesobacillus foraminis TaxID=279826 RepID=UPI001BE9A266|nr:AraC family transcriptional regulator [Mesobacillus foraminis]MBT2757822.1 helix-turn-helix transcriptional regulator [Mesobacillus foraminis]